ncbi:MAG: hypothetical protein A2Z83_02805 [Omnitrophica bacterium GWA2_52_8]|nr:MAG: hypothetical protein A2Z83_02805 [Omnitrophica bacterium GWA2_52_8]
MKLPVRKIILAAGTAITLASSSLAKYPLLYAEAVEPRTLRLGVAVTDIYKKESSWKNSFERRVAYASQIFDREFKIKFKVVQYWDWHPPKDTQDTRVLIDDLMHRYALSDDIDMMIGLTRLTDPKLVENIGDLHTLGNARPFSGYLVLRYPSSPLFKVQQETVMTHELGHLFGAIHNKDKNSIMAPIVKYQIPSAFDEQNKDILKLTRKLNFKNGLESLPVSDIQLLLSSYTKLIHSDQPYDFYYSLGVFYLKLGQTSDTITAWKKAKQVNPETPIIYHDLGILYLRLGRFDEAVSELSKAAGLFTMPTNQKEKAQTLSYLGAAYFQNKQYDTAYRTWSNALALTPGDSDLKANIAMVQMMQGKYARAIKALEELLKEDPKNVKILSNLGYAHFKNGNSQTAIRFMNMALQNSAKKSSGLLGNDSISDIHQNLGTIYWNMGNRKVAMDHFKTSCKSNETPECHRKMGYLYYELQEWNNAIGELASAIPYYKEDAEVYGLLGVALSRIQEYEKAVGIFREGLKYIQDQKSAALLHKNLGSIYMQYQQWDLAVTEFQLALAKNWNVPESHMGLGVAYYAQSRLPQARQSFMNVLRINPNHAKAKELIAKIDQQVSSSV